MNRRSIRAFAWTFFVVNLLAVVWPGLVPFNRVRPLVLGMPFVMVWLAGWLVASMAALIVIEWVEHRDSED
jgi:Protein of unknown function (DUF3311)